MKLTGMPGREDLVEKLSQFKKEMQGELHNILSWWKDNMVDETHGGFYGQRKAGNTLVENAPKGVVLNARILWTFAAAYRSTGTEEYLPVAHRAFNYIKAHFIDHKFGGVYWSVAYTGAPLDKKKQVYALSFALYAFAEYYRCTKNELAKNLAIELFEAIENHSRDMDRGGYIEAFTEDWQPIADLRLSNKDANEKKTMNTHLHVLEAYTNLYRIHPDEKIKDAILSLLKVFENKIIDPATHHLILFFDEAWNRKGQQISYGHDIEAAWLLAEAATVIGDNDWVNKINKRSIKIVDAAMEGLDDDGGLWHEYDGDNKHWIKEKHWWPQAEAMVGFFHAYECTGENKYLDQVLHSWHFIKKYLIDHKNGEWYWGVTEDYSLISGEDKAGFWKCPYHNGRACIELQERIEKFANNEEIHTT